MGEFLYLVLRKIRLNIRRLSLFTLLLIVFYLFFFKYHHHHPRELRILEYTEGESRKASQLRTLKELYAHNIFSNTQTAASQAIDVRGPQSSNNNGTKLAGQVQGRVLLLYDSIATHTAKAVKVILDSLRVPVDAFKYRANKTITLTVNEEPTLAPLGKYSVLVFVDHVSYFHRWPQSVRDHFDNYCNDFNVTSIFFPRGGKDLMTHHYHHLFSYKALSSYPIKSTIIKQVYISTKLDLHFSKNNIALPNSLISGHLWHLFPPMYSSDLRHHLQRVTNGLNCSQEQATPACNLMSQLDHLRSQSTKTLQSSSTHFEKICTVQFRNHLGVPSQAPCILIDQVFKNGPHRIFIGSPATYWLTKILLMDILRLFSQSKLLLFDRRRWVLIDIDDIFVAPLGLKMNKSDVQALVKTQEKLRTMVPGLTFNLGFCGGYYDRGTPAEVEGSQELVRVSAKFQWFGHIFSHQQPHNLPPSNLTILMEQNKEFARNASIEVNSGYSVSPHHSGVYPIYPPLYTSWKRVWNITMTTTEEYPNLYPEHMRHGFIHRGIMVVPRQTCKLYTHTISYETFPGGREALEATANGGSVFNTILFNPISIFMTHVTNYATDRLAPQLFVQLFEFIIKWTNLELMTDQPLNLGKRYFEIFPEDRVPLWRSPCDHRRHLDIYPQSKNCTRLPSLLILGPQKTGTTALYSFLKEHPLITANRNNKDHFEEVQFFSNETLYNYGVEWYMDQFQYPASNNQVIFEKSATYFTHSLAPKRVKSLLPDIKLIVILANPVKRAYSWYQHMRAHKSVTALKYNFSQVIGSDNQSNIADTGLLSLRHRCISPGKYYKHLELWLNHFLPEQILLVDGDTLVENPAQILDKVQDFLSVEILNYSEHLKWNSKKGFYCATNHCLGPSKGRKYPVMADIDRVYLEQLYYQDNVKLAQLMKRVRKFDFPNWLRTQISR